MTLPSIAVVRCSAKAGRARCLSGLEYTIWPVVHTTLVDKDLQTVPVEEVTATPVLLHGYAEGFRHVLKSAKA